MRRSLNTSKSINKYKRSNTRRTFKKILTPVTLLLMTQMSVACADEVTAAPKTTNVDSPAQDVAEQAEMQSPNLDNSATQEPNIPAKPSLNVPEKPTYAVQQNISQQSIVSGLSQQDVKAAESAQAADSTQEKSSQTAPAKDTVSPKDIADVYGPTEANETLWSIAKFYRPSRSVSIPQIVVATYKINDKAFEDHNIHGLITGSMLRLPSLALIKKESTAEANAFIQSEKSRQVPSQVDPSITPPPPAKLSDYEHAHPTVVTEESETDSTEPEQAAKSDQVTKPDQATKPEQSAQSESDEAVNSSQEQAHQASVQVTANDAAEKVAQEGTEEVPEATIDPNSILASGGQVDDSSEQLVSNGGGAAPMNRMDGQSANDPISDEAPEQQETQQFEADQIAHDKQVEAMNSRLTTELTKIQSQLDELKTTLAKEEEAKRIQAAEEADPGLMAIPQAFLKLAEKHSWLWALVLLPIILFLFILRLLFGGRNKTQPEQPIERLVPPTEVIPHDENEPKQRIEPEILALDP
ncbi:MAG: FimV/HubP family polar landmark protein, partial [Vibrio sp.]